MPKSIFRRFPNNTPRESIERKVILEFTKHLGDTPGIPAFLKCSRAIESHPASVLAVLNKNPHLRNLAYTEIGKRIMSMDEHEFLESLAGNYPAGIKQKIDERLMMIILNKINRYNKGIALPSVIVRDIGLDFKTYKRLTKKHPDFIDKVNETVGGQIFGLADSAFIKSFKHATFTSKRIRFFIELNLQRIILKEMVASNEFRYTPIARKIGITKDTVSRLKKRYPAFNTLLKYIKDFISLENIYLENMNGIKYIIDKSSIKYGAKGEKNQMSGVAKYLAKTSNFDSTIKLFSVYYLLNYWSKNEYSMSHHDYKKLLEYVYSVMPAAHAIQRFNMIIQRKGNLEESHRLLLNRKISTTGRGIFSFIEFWASIALFVIVRTSPYNQAKV